MKLDTRSERSAIHITFTYRHIITQREEDTMRTLYKRIFEGRSALPVSETEIQVSSMAGTFVDPETTFRVALGEPLYIGLKPIHEEDPHALPKLVADITEWLQVPIENVNVSVSNNRIVGETPGALPAWVWEEYKKSREQEPDPAHSNQIKFKIARYEKVRQLLEFAVDGLNAIILGIPHDLEGKPKKKYVIKITFEFPELIRLLKRQEGIRIHETDPHVLHEMQPQPVVYVFATDEAIKHIQQILHHSCLIEPVTAAETEPVTEKDHSKKRCLLG